MIDMYDDVTRRAFALSGYLKFVKVIQFISLLYYVGEKNKNKT